MKINTMLQRVSREPGFWDKLQKAGFYLTDDSGDSSICSKLLTDLGYSPEELSADAFLKHLHPADETMYHDLWERVVSGWEDEFFAEFRIADRKTGGWCWVQTHGVVLSRDGGGRMVSFAGIDTNITARKESELLMHSHLAEMETIFNQAESMRVAGLLANSTLDLDKTIGLVLKQAYLLLPFQKAAISRYREGKFTLLGQELELGELEEAPEKPKNHPVWMVLEHKSPELQDDLGTLDPPFPGDPSHTYRSWLGIPLIFRNELLGVLEFWHSSPGFFHSEQIWPAMGFADSVAESLSNANRFEVLREDVRTDPLTGLFSRRYFQSSGPELLDICCRENRPIAVLLMDIDHFKNINDTHGHLVGDTVLMTITQLCRVLLRRDDMFYRFGGEEFIALLPNTDATVAERVAERLREIAAAAHFRNIEDGVTVSIGVAPIAPGHRVSFEDAIREADDTMYRAKEAGRNRVVVSHRWSTSPQR